MRRFHRDLLAASLITLLVHASVVALGSLRVCWGTEHRHGGVDARDCSMHHQAAPEAARESHLAPAAHHAPDAHHARGRAAAPPHHDGQRVACGCSSDLSTPYVGPAGELAPTVVSSDATPPVLGSRQRVNLPDEIRFPPLSPPPRSSLSRRS